MPDNKKTPENKNQIRLTDPAFYENRELSWLQFERRCLSEARTKENPLLERLKFLSITASNLDEFFMVRAASLQDMVNAGYKKKDIAGMTASQQLEAILEDTHKFANQQYWTLNRMLLPELRENGILLCDEEELTNADRKFLDAFFTEELFPVLTPMAVDSSRPFPLIRNKSLNLGALVARKEDAGPGILSRAHTESKKAEKSEKGEKGDKSGKGGKNKEARANYEFATVQVPSVVSRIVTLPDRGDGLTRLILLEDVIRMNMSRLFQSYDVLAVGAYRITRNGDLTIDEEEAEDLLLEIEKQLKKRQRGYAIRLEIEKDMDERLLHILEKELSVGKEKVYETDGPLDLTFLMKIWGLDGFEDLHEHRYAPPQPVPQLPAGCNIFEQIRKGDIFLHHPYQTFQPVIDFVADAATDPEVLAIKQTLYRVSGNSPIIAALARAAENGKQVTVLVELKARFDEENNIVWARKLEQAGCHVIYGLVGLKTHSKITLVVRKEEDGIRRYVHLATGNYNDSTAKLYTDIGILTCREGIGADATAFFNMLSGYSEPRSWNSLSLAPLWMKDRFLYLIDRERRHALRGEPALIKGKMNALCEPDVIRALYEASAAGVEIDLIVRGICCLKVGIPGVSENIHVRSIVGNYLEHSRIYYFHNAGNPEIYGSSADWMPRNLERRVEILFPLEDEICREKALHILDLELADTVKAHILKPDGSYERVDRRGKETVNSQLILGEEAKREAEAPSFGAAGRVFIPVQAAEPEE